MITDPKIFWLINNWLIMIAMYVIIMSTWQSKYESDRSLLEDDSCYLATKQ